MDMTQTTTLTEAQRRDLAEIGESITECERDLEAGRERCVSHTPNGREIRLVRGGFRVQPANDNYWLDVNSIDDAMAAYERPQDYR